MFTQLFTSKIWKLPSRTHFILKCKFSTSNQSPSPPPAPPPPRLDFLPSNLYYHTFNNIKGTHIFVLGTSHITSLSAGHTRKLIHAVNPATIVLELCEYRRNKIKKDPESEKYYYDRNLLARMSEGKTIKEKLSYAHMMLNFNTCSNLGLEIGGEFLAALEEGEKAGSKFILGDLDARETALQMYSHIHFLLVLWKYITSVLPWTKAKKRAETIKQVQSLVAKDPEYIYNATRHYPRSKEREENITKAILNAEGTVVCIVGYGHLHAIKLLLKNAFS